MPFVALLCRPSLSTAPTSLLSGGRVANPSYFFRYGRTVTRQREITEAHKPYDGFTSRRAAAVAHRGDGLQTRPTFSGMGAR